MTNAQGVDICCAIDHGSICGAVALYSVIPHSVPIRLTLCQRHRNRLTEQLDAVRVCTRATDPKTETVGALSCT